MFLQSVTALLFFAVESMCAFYGHVPARLFVCGNWDTLHLTGERKNTSPPFHAFSCSKEKKETFILRQLREPSTVTANRKSLRCSHSGFKSAVEKITQSWRKLIYSRRFRLTLGTLGRNVLPCLQLHVILCVYCTPLHPALCPGGDDAERKIPMKDVRHDLSNACVVLN